MESWALVEMYNLLESEANKDEGSCAVSNAQVPLLPDGMIARESSAAARNMLTNLAAFAHITRSEVAARSGPQLSAHGLQGGPAQPQTNPNVPMHMRLQCTTVSEFSRCLVALLIRSSSNSHWRRTTRITQDD